MPFPQYSLAQTSRSPLGQSSKVKTGVSSIATLGTGIKDYGYKRSLNESVKEEIISLLTAEELPLLFEKLDDADRQDLFSHLSPSQKRVVFVTIADSEKQKIFQTLGDKDKIDLFALIDDKERMILLSNLGYMEKSRLINSLSISEKKIWLEKYPELASSIELKGEEFVPEGAEKKNSRLEELFSGQFPSSIDKDIRQFGYDFFIQKSTFTPEKNVPVGSDYYIGPGDSFTINLWGNVEEAHYATVSRDGTITLSRLGTLSVSGLTFSELKIFLYNRFKEYYPDFKMNIAMDALKSIDIFMVGELNNPGTYSLSSLSTVVSALYASGGPNKNGTLRNISILNNDELVKTIDLYDFFIRGAKGDDITIKQGYTVFVPVIGPTVAVAGHVKRPAIYEIKEGQTLEQVIDYAGGLLPTSHLQNIIVERIVGQKGRVIVSFDIDSSNEKNTQNLKTVLKDGDLVKIYPVHKNIEKVVYLEGNVKYPNEYELKNGMKLKDIIPSYDYLLPESYLPQAEILRLVPPNLHPEIKTFDLGKMLDGDEGQNLALHDRDRITIYNAWEKQNIPEVTISGAVRNPGIFRLYKDMTVKDLIFAAGNSTKDAYLEKGELTRVLSGDSGADIVKLEFSPKRATEGSPQDNIILKEDDKVFIREIPKYKTSLEKKVYLEGEFRFPGEYSFKEGETISSVIERAGGLTEEAYPYGAVFTRESVKDIQSERKREYIEKLEQDIFTISAYSAETSLDASQASVALQTLNAKREMLEKLKQAEPTGRMIINILDAVLIPSGDNDLALRAGDRLIVGKRPDSVFVIGEVYNPNAIIHRSGSDVGDYLNLVGGITGNADKKQLYIVRADGTVMSKKQEKFGLFNWDSSSHRWGFGSFKSVKMEPGDTIIVPKKVLQFSWLKWFKDTTSVLYQLAVSAGVLNDILKD
ncbi:MAG: polysaccharide biosynthesis protein [Desulfatiglans sp.]|jgi:protein involved in polysaccharide export with SLBB domain|nr:polysaccharide biosynthesis protein [Desulfatiglans sp.]